MSTETIRTFRDGEPKTATSSFTHLPSSEFQVFKLAFLYVHRNHKGH